MPGKKTLPKKAAPRRTRFRLTEDWLAVILAFVIILLARLGALGPNGLNIPF